MVIMQTITHKNRTVINIREQYTTFWFKLKGFSHFNIITLGGSDVLVTVWTEFLPKKTNVVTATVSAVLVRLPKIYSSYASQTKNHSNPLLDFCFV